MHDFVRLEKEVRMNYLSNWQRTLCIETTVSALEKMSSPIRASKAITHMLCLRLSVKYTEVWVVSLH